MQGPDVKHIGWHLESTESTTYDANTSIITNTDPRRMTTQLVRYVELGLDTPATDGLHSDRTPLTAPGNVQSDKQ